MIENISRSVRRFAVSFVILILTPETTGPMIDSDLFESYENLIEIEVLGKRVAVPENNKLLRCFQYLSLETISYGDFCWNGECTNCQIWYHIEGDEDAKDKSMLSCRTKVCEGMVITKLSPHIELQGINK